MTKKLVGLFPIDSLDEALPSRLRAHFAKEDLQSARQLQQVFKPLVQGEWSKCASLSAVLAQLRRCRPEAESKPAVMQQLQMESNRVLWNGAEEAAALSRRLFEQLYVIGIFQWTPALQECVALTSAALKARVEALTKVCVNLAETLWMYDNDAPLDEDPEQWFAFIRPLRREGIDSSLNTHLEQTQQFVSSQAESYHARFTDFFHFMERASHAVDKVTEKVLCRELPDQLRAAYEHIIIGLSIWENDANAGGILLDELSRSLRKDDAVTCGYVLFHEYFKRLFDFLFATSRSLKGTVQVDFISIRQALTDAETELRELKRTVARYREFMLITDPDPYVRTRLGFKEWVVGEEPLPCRQLYALEIELESSLRLYEAMIASCSGVSCAEISAQADATKPELTEALHVLSQPTLTALPLKRHLSHISGLLMALRELTNRDRSIVNLMARTLLKLLCDERCQEPFYLDFQFMNLYLVHHHLVQPMVSDPTHRRHIESLEQLVLLGPGVSSQAIIAVAQELNPFVCDWLNHLKALDEIALERMLELRYGLGLLFHHLRSNEEHLRIAKEAFTPLEHSFDRFIVA